MEHVDKKFQNDFDIVLMAVKNEGRSLKFSSETLKNNKEIVMNAILNDPRSILYASLKLQSDREIAKKVVKKNGMTLDYLNPFKGDFVLKAIDINYRIMENRIKDYVNDREILKKYLSKNGEFLRILNYLPHVVQVDEELLTIVFKNSGISMMHAPRHLVTKKLAIMAIKEDALAYAYCNNFFDDFDVTIEAVSSNGKMIKYANEILKQNKEIVLALFVKIKMHMNL